MNVLRLPLIAGLLLTVAAGVPEHAPDFRTPLSHEDRARLVLSRLTFGPRPGNLAALQRLGLDKWIDRQLHPEHLPQNPVLAEKLTPLETLTMEPRQLTQRYPPQPLIRAMAEGRAPLPTDPTRKAAYQALIARFRQNEPNQPRFPRLRHVTEPALRAALAQNTPQQAVAYDLTAAKIYRAVYSNRQLEEVLTDFWYNHFNVFLDKGPDRYLVTSYERDAIRPHVLGKFEDLLRATAQNPAMLFYLDNWQSLDPNSIAARRRPNQHGLNENYARELMELHTLGVDGGYTQKDVVEVARCFTGWTIRQPRLAPAFEFNPRMHDRGAKIVLGHRIPPGGGVEDGLEVLRILAHHPSTARFLSRRLAQRFVADEPPASLVDRMARRFLKTNGDLREVMKTMIRSREFSSRGAWHAKVKSPFELVVSALRASGADITLAAPIARQIAQLGQPLYRKLEPTGYSNTGEDWVNSAALLGRMNFAVALAANRVPGVSVPVPPADGLHYGSPEFQRR